MTVLGTLVRIRAEFMEMPGLRLTAAQVERLCGVDGVLCKTVLDALVDAKFLRVSGDGIYSRLTDGEIPRPRPAKAAQTGKPDEHLRSTA